MDRLSAYQAGGVGDDLPSREGEAMDSATTPRCTAFHPAHLADAGDRYQCLRRPVLRPPFISLCHAGRRCLVIAHAHGARLFTPTAARCCRHDPASSSRAGGRRAADSGGRQRRALSRRTPQRALRAVKSQIRCRGSCRSGQSVVRRNIEANAKEHTHEGNGHLSPRSWATRRRRTAR